jgi:peptidoglycan/xylan/chitin deacetylase (PgdA/CDA1 family)
MLPASELFAIPAQGTVSAEPLLAYHVPVLMYHRIAPASERGGTLADLSVDPAVFDAQLAMLEARGWQAITSRQLAWAVAANDRLPARTFVITIDDGRADGFTHAFPILVKHGFVATFFVITGRVDDHHHLTWAQLCEMQTAGMEIGNHTAGHRDASASSRSQTDRQVMDAQRAIARHLGAPAVSFAYPFGQMPPNLVTSVMAAGLKVAYSTAGGAEERAASAYAWPRIRIHPSTTPMGVLWLIHYFW